MTRVIIFFTLFLVLFIQNSSQQLDKAAEDDLGLKSIQKFFAGKEKFEVKDDLKPVMSKKVYVNIDHNLKSFDEYVKKGSLKFNRITFYGQLFNGSFTRGEDRTHSELNEKGDVVKKLVYRSIGRFELKLETFDAEVTWAPPSGRNRTCEIVGLAKCNNGLDEVPEESNVLRVFYDNAIIMHPWIQVAQNTFKEHGALKTLQFKSYMKYCTDDVTSQERRNVTAGIDELFMKDQVRTVLVKELAKQYQDVLYDERDKIDPLQDSNEASVQSGTFDHCDC